MTSSTTDLVDLLIDRRSHIPDAAYSAARILTLDVLGVAVAGSATREGRVVVDAARRMGRSGASPVPTAGDRLDVAGAALATGTMAYSIGLTDTHAESITHPGPSVVPVALTVGAAVGAGDQEILTAIILGVETVVRIGSAINPSHRARGFHPTGTCNPFGCAVATAYLLGLDRAGMLDALGLAGSMAGGLYEFRHEGSMLMALHGGLPAQSGVLAGYLAAEGFTGPHTVLEGPEGFLRGYADHYDASRLASEQPTWGVQQLSLRPYCACRYAHAAIDAILALMGRHGFGSDDVESVTVWTHKTAVEQEVEPTTLVSARLSTCFNVALTMVHGPRLEEVTDADLRDERVRSLARRVTVVEDHELTRLFPVRWACRAEVVLRDGRTFVNQVDTPKGEPTNPLTTAEVEAKFRRLSEPHLGAERAERAAHAVLRPAPTDRLATILHDLSEPSVERA